MTTIDEKGVREVREKKKVDEALTRLVMRFMRRRVGAKHLTISDALERGDGILRDLMESANRTLDLRIELPIEDSELEDFAKRFLDRLQEFLAFFDDCLSQYSGCEAESD